MMILLGTTYPHVKRQPGGGELVVGRRLQLRHRSDGGGSGPTSGFQVIHVPHIPPRRPFRWGWARKRLAHPSSFPRYPRLW